MSRICWPYLASLFSPTPLTVPSSARVAGDDGRDLAQRRVVEDHVRGHALLLGGRGPPGAQPLEDRRGLRRQLGGRGAGDARPAFAGAPARARSGSRRIMTSRSPPSTSPLALGEHQRAVVALDARAAPAPAAAGRRRATRPRAARCRCRTRVSASWRNWVTLSVFWPSRMSMDWPAPNFWPRSRCSRSTVDSSFCAATVPSQDSGGVRQVSQLPHARALLAEVGEQLDPAALAPSRTAPASRRGARPAPRRCATSPSELSIILRCWTTSCSPYASQAVDGRPSRPARPVSW